MKMMMLAAFFFAYMYMLSSVSGGEFIRVLARAEFIVTKNIYAYYTSTISAENGAIGNSSIVFTNFDPKVDALSIMTTATAQLFSREVKAAKESAKTGLKLWDGDWFLVYRHNSRNQPVVDLYYRGLNKSMVFHLDYAETIAFVTHCHDAETTAKSWLYDLMKATPSGY